MIKRKKSTILILDFGSQYTQLIARRIRENSVYSEILPFYTDISLLKEYNPDGIILSGGPASTYDEKAPKIHKKVFDLDIPILGICYGLQLIAHNSNCQIKKSEKREYGKAVLEVLESKNIFKNLKKESVVWMSHGDCVLECPPYYKIIGKTSNSNFAAIKHKSKEIFGIQFHPEVTHTDEGMKIIRNFIFEVCNSKPDWTMETFIEDSIIDVKNKIGNGKVLLALSGGVD